MDQDISLTDTDQTSTEEQNYRETLRGVCSYIGWTHIFYYRHGKVLEIDPGF